MFWLIISSSIILAGLVSAKMYEQKSGNSLWSILHLEKLKRFLEIKIHKSLGVLKFFNSRNFKLLVSYLWRVSKNYYQKLQEKTTEKISQMSRPAALDNHNNKAASFYLKSIREHKNNSNSEEVKNNLPE